MADLEARMPTVVGKEEVDGNNEFTAITWPPNGIRSIILVTHDESTFAAHDGLKSLCLSDGEQPLRKKRQDRSIHVTDFLCNIIGRLAIDEEKAAQHLDLQAAACIIMQPGTQHDGWWTSDKLCKKVCDLAIPIFEAQFPNCQALFAFDNATGHSAFAPDALRAGAMNLSSVGKQPKMRAAMWGHGVSQDLVFAYDHSNETLRGQAKGLKAVLGGTWAVGSYPKGAMQNMSCGWRNLLRQKNYGQPIRLQSTSRNDRGVNCCRWSSSDILPKISLRAQLHRKLLGSR